MDDQDTARLERIMQAGFDTLADLLRELSEGQSATNGRLDNLIAISGGETRQLRQDVDALERRVSELEKKAS